MNIRYLAITLIILLGLLPRLWFAYSLYGNADQVSYDIVRGILDNGGNVYAETKFYNYSPVWMGVLKSADTVSDTTGTAYHTVIRTLLTCADLALAVLLAWLAGNGRRFNGLAFALYWLNPGAIAIVGFGGQFETLALIPLAAGVIAWRAGKPLGWVFALGVLAVLVKHSTVFLVWALFVYAVGVRRALLWMVATASIFLLSLTSFLPMGAEGIWRNVLTYSSLSNGYGLTMLLPRSQALLLFYSFLLLLPILARRLSLTRTLWLSSLGYLMFVTGFGAHYAMPALAFGSLDKRTGVVAWMIGVMVALVSLPIPNTDHALIAFYIWAAAAIAFTWGLAELLRYRRRREPQQVYVT